jgi:hypothetical protein
MGLFLSVDSENPMLIVSHLWKAWLSDCLASGIIFTPIVLVTSVLEISLETKCRRFHFACGRNFECSKVLAAGAFHWPLTNRKIS